MRTEDARAESRKRKSDLAKLREKIAGVDCCYYCSDEDTGDLVERLGLYGVAALPALIEVMALPFPSPLIAASGILGQIGWSAQEAIPSLLQTLEYENTFAPHATPMVVEAAKKALKRIRAYQAGTRKGPTVYHGPKEDDVK